MTEEEVQAEQFERHRAYLREVARRMLGSETEAEDAVQEAWLRLRRGQDSDVENLRAWLTTVVSRICLDMLRRRQTRREEELSDWIPRSIVPLTPAADPDPEAEALLADSLGVALLVVLEALSPAERLAFVLHDMFGVPFEEIAPIVERSPLATRQLASRARRRVRGAGAADEAGGLAERQVVEAFLAASRQGDFEALISVLDPDVVFRGATGPAGPAVPSEVRGADTVAKLVLARGTPMAPFGRPALIDGRPGAVVVVGGSVTALVAFRIEAGRVAQMDLLVDPARLRDLQL